MVGLEAAVAGNLPGRWVAGPQHVPLPVRGGGTGPVPPGATGIPGLGVAPGWSSGGWVTGLGGGTGRDRASRTARAGGTSCRPGRAGRVPGQPWPRRVAGWAERPSVPVAGGGARPAGGVPDWADRVQWRAGGELGWAGVAHGTDGAVAGDAPARAGRSAGAGLAAGRGRRRVRRSQSQAARLAGRYGSAQSGASSAARPTATAAIRPATWTAGRVIRSTTTVGSMFLNPRLAPRNVSASAANGTATASARIASAAGPGAAPPRVSGPRVSNPASGPAKTSISTAHSTEATSTGRTAARRIAATRPASSGGPLPAGRRRARK